MPEQMFEHMKNYKMLLQRIASWLRPDGLLFVHIFCHRTTPYHFASDDGWMATHFFSGRALPFSPCTRMLISVQVGRCPRTICWYVSPCALLRAYILGLTVVQLYFQDDVSLVRSWYVNGRHYARTCEDWLVRQDSNAAAGIQRLQTDAAGKGVGAEEGRKMFYRYVAH